MTITKLLVNIFRSKTRSLLTMAGIAVGVFSVVLISTVGAVGTSEVSKTLVTMGVDTLLIQSAKNSVSVTLTDGDVTAVRNIDGVSDVMPLMASVTEAKMINRRLDCYVWGVDKSADKLISLEAEHGRLINNSDTAARAKVCVIDEQFALASYGRSNVVGKTLSMFLGGKYHTFEIIGVAQSGLSGLQGMLTNIMPGFMYIPITTMQSLCGRTTYDKIAVKLTDMSSDTAVVSRVTDELNLRNGFTDGYVCNNLLSQKGQLDDILDIVTTALSLVAGISLVVSGISVTTTMMMSVGERTREIGIKKAIGAKSRDICLEFLTESVILTMIGSAAGIAFGLAVSFVGCLLVRVPFTVNAGSLAVSAVVSSAIGAAFGAYPAAKAAKLRPAEALRAN
ncbi:MAG: ABC transporter permease [Lachnospiraceae bacterium]|nr:ABC transporter permease [Ruminococcus sp.]MCM1275203.1 ABC transporter permease [Lachnospiraceae bacterium]